MSETIGSAFHERYSVELERKIIDFEEKFKEVMDKFQIEKEKNTREYRFYNLFVFETAQGKG